MRKSVFNSEMMKTKLRELGVTGINSDGIETNGEA